MYPTDLIYGAIFNFTEKDSPIEHFEVLGYEGSNFIPLTGSAFINIGGAVLLTLALKVGNYICVKFYDRQIARVIGCKLEEMGVQSAVLMFYL